jgi:hypothetical protein
MCRMLNSTTLAVSRLGGSLQGQRGGPAEQGRAARDRGLRAVRCLCATRRHQCQRRAPLARSPVSCGQCLTRPYLSPADLRVFLMFVGARAAPQARRRPLPGRRLPRARAQGGARRHRQGPPATGGTAISKRPFHGIVCREPLRKHTG